MSKPVNAEAERRAAVARVRSAIAELGEEALVSAVAERAGLSAAEADAIVARLDVRPRCVVTTRRGEEFGFDPASGRARRLARPGEPVDQLRRPLAEPMVSIFDDRKLIERLRARLADVVGHVAGLSGRLAGAWLDLAAIQAHLENASGLLAASAPYCVCPTCGGAGCRAGQPLKICPSCAGACFMTRNAFDHLDVALREIASGYQSESTPVRFSD